MGSFPHAAYSRHVLEPSFEQARSHLFEPMLQANLAHVVMLTEQRIIPAEQGSALLTGLLQIESEGVTAFAYQPGVEDLFFAMEQRLIELTSPEIGGSLQLARSRNDLGAALHRMALRAELLRLGDALANLRGAVLKLAEDHLTTLMPGYTHTQPAQPTTFAHYLGGMLAALERDAKRLRAAYDTTNQSPLGVAAFTATAFPIDRGRVASLLGFAGLLPNGQDAIGAADYATETAGMLMTLASHLSRVARDLLFWATQEAGAIRIDDSFIQISSIMPQKRNPVVLEHLRARIAQVYGDGNAVFVLGHSSPYGDTQDAEDELMMPLLRLTDTSWGILDLFGAVFSTLEINRDHLAARADAGFTTATELADTLVRGYGVAFRSAHRIVASVVSEANAAGRGIRQITAEDVEAAAQAVLGRSLGITSMVVQDALDPLRFVERRVLPGGSAPSTVQASLNTFGDQLEQDRDWLVQHMQTLAEAEKELGAAVVRHSGDNDTR